MRLLLDTNTVVSGFIWSGTPARLMRFAQAGRVELVTSERLLRELQTVIERRKFTSALAQRNRSPWDVYDTYSRLCEIVESTSIPPTVLRDPDDDEVHATAAAGNANMIVTGDLDLLDIGEFRSIPILTAAQAVARIEEQETT